MANSSIGGMSAASGWTLVVSDTNTGAGAAYLLTTTAGSYDGAMHATAAVAYDVFGFAIKPPTSGGSCVPLLTLLGTGKC